MVDVSHSVGQSGSDSTSIRAGEHLASVDISFGPIATLAPEAGPSTIAGPSAMPSRPLSEISENEDRRRSVHRLSHHSRSGKDDEKRSSRTTSRPGSRAASRPTSLVMEDPSTKRLSGHIQTLTLNLNDYAAAVKRPPSISNKSRDSLLSNPPTPGGGRSVSAGATLGGPKPERPVLALRTTSISSIKELKKEEDDGVATSPKSPS